MVTQTHADKQLNSPLPTSAPVAIVCSSYNSSITSQLLVGAQKTLMEAGIKATDILVTTTPGAFEIPLALQLLAKQNKYRGFIALGCLIKGDTAHFEYIAAECTRGIMQVSLEYNLPIAMGVLTTYTVEQARERIGGVHGHKGVEAAQALIEMIKLFQVQS